MGGKPLALVLILALTVALAACGGGDEVPRMGPPPGRPSSGPAAPGS